MTITCRPIDTDRDQAALDNLMTYCMQNGLNMLSTRTNQDRISVTVDDNGSGAYRVLESYVAMIHAVEQEKK